MNVNAIRALLVYALVLPTALALGYFLATPGDSSSLIYTGVVLAILSFPLLLKWHYPIMFFTWNMTAVLAMLPGSPELWLTMAFVCLIFSLVERAMSKNMRFISVPSLTLPIAFILLVVIGTAQARGGIGLRVFGSETVGGRAYFWILAGAAGFWAMASRKIPANQGMLYTGLFFLGGLMNTMSSLIPYGPKELYFLAWIFPVTTADVSILRASGSFGQEITRFYGLALTCLGLLCFLLARYGVKGCLSVRKSWRFMLVALLIAVASSAGYRSMFILLVLTVALVFLFEGLLRTRYTLALAMIGMVAAVLVIPFADKLPLSLQRTLSIFPINVNPIARYEAEASTEWRVQMWKVVMPLVPEYLWLGKGVGIAGTDLTSTSDATRQGFLSSQEEAMLSGNYHNGPLTVLIPFGIWGAIGWLWFLGAAIRALYLNYRYGEESIKTINTFLLAFFVAKTVLFFAVFGDFRSDFSIFVGVVGLGVALNGGIRRPEELAAETERSAERESEAPLAGTPSFSH
jgi:hypothetical protein